MIPKIQPPYANVGGSLAYNEKKADGREGVHEEGAQENVGEKGHLVAVRNVPEGESLEGEFARLSRLARVRSGRGRKTENEAFHMSLNPSEADFRKLGEKKMLEIIDETMDRLGYGGSPYGVYFHIDTGRPHFHVVTTRIGQDGRKVSDSFEVVRLQRIMADLGKRYGFRVGSDEEDIRREEKNAPEAKREASEAKREKDGKEGAKKPFVPPFSKDSPLPRAEQFRAAHEEAMLWSFTTAEQYRMLMKYRFSVGVIYEGGGVNYVGLDEKGKVCTVLVEEEQAGVNASQAVADKIAATDMKTRRRQRERLEGILEEEAEESRSWKEFVKNMRRKGVYVVLSHSERGEAFGVTYIDRGTRCVFKGSETARDIAWLRGLAEAGGKAWALPAAAKAAAKTRTAGGTAVRTPSGVRPTGPRMESSDRFHWSGGVKSHGSGKTGRDLRDTLTEDEERKNDVQPKI